MATGFVSAGPVAAVPDPGSHKAPEPHAVATAVRELKFGSRVTGAISTQSFETVGVTWSAGADDAGLEIAVRTRSSGGWTGWQELERSDDAENHTRGVRPGTDPLYVGPSTAVQAKVTAGKLPAGLRIEVVDPGTSTYDAAARPGLSAAAATGGVARPAVMSRAQWGADESKVRAAPTYMPTVRAAVLHHTAGPNTYSRAAVPRIIRGDYAYHLKRGWNDIGYNALVDRFGRIWEGRAGGLDRAVMGAHAGGFNTDTFGVSVIGNFDTGRPTPAAVAAVSRVVAWKLDLDHRDPGGKAALTSAGGGTARYPAGKVVRLPVVMGHRNTGYTACPGKNLYPYLPVIRRQVTGIMKAALLNPSGPPATVARGRPVSISTRSLAKQTWQLAVAQTCLTSATTTVASGSVAGGKAFAATWNGQLNGAPARPGRYTLTLTSKSSRATARQVTRSVVVLPPRSPAEPAATPPGGTGGFTIVPPSRLWDSTSGVNAGLGPDGRVAVPVLGRAGVPATGVSAVMLSLTAACETSATAVSAWPTGYRSNRPLSGLRAGVPRTVTVNARVGADGSVTVGNAAGVSEMAVDVLGYWSTAGAPVRAISSQRVYNSRADALGPLTDGDRRRIALPATIGGVALNQIAGVMVDVSALSPAAAGTLRMFRFADSPTGPPTVVYRKGESVDNLTVVPVNGGSISAAAIGGSTHFTVDVRGLVLAGGTTGTLFTATKPVLISGSGEQGALKANATRKIKVTGVGTGVPGSATAVLLNVTAVAPTRTTLLQVHPTGGAKGIGTAVRAPAGETRGNEVLVPVGSDGTVTMVNGAGSTRFRVDTHGWFR